MLTNSLAPSSRRELECGAGHQTSSSGLCTHTHRCVHPLRACLPKTKEINTPPRNCADAIMPESREGRRGDEPPPSAQGPLPITAKQTPQQGLGTNHTPAPRWASSTAQELSDHRGFVGSTPAGNVSPWPLVTCFFCPVMDLSQKVRSFSYSPVGVSPFTSLYTTGFQGQSKQTLKVASP